MHSLPRTLPVSTAFIVSCLFYVSACNDFSPLTVRHAALASKPAVSYEWMHQQIAADLFPLQGRALKTSEVRDYYLTQKHRNLLYIEFNSDGYSLEVNTPTKALNSRATPFVALMNDVQYDKSVLPYTGIPVFTFAKNKDAVSILIPDCEAAKIYDDLNNSKFEKYVSWHKKIEQIFWRGTTTGGMYTPENWHDMPRAQLALLSEEHPAAIDAGFSSFSAAQGATFLAEQLPLKSYASINDHLKFKYLIDVDGNSCSYIRMFWLLLSNSVVFKHTSDNLQWYYKGLTALQHYIPVQEDFSDIIAKYEWAKTHDEEAKKIARAATVRAQEIFSRHGIESYLFLLITEYASLFDA